MGDGMGAWKDGRLGKEGDAGEIEGPEMSRREPPVVTRRRAEEKCWEGLQTPALGNAQGS